MTTDYCMKNETANIQKLPTYVQHPVPRMVRLYQEMATSLQLQIRAPERIGLTGQKIGKRSYCASVTLSQQQAVDLRDRLTQILTEIERFHPRSS